MSYTPIEGVLDTSWVGSAPYAPPVALAAGDWREGLTPVYPVGIRPGEVGAQFITKQQFVDPLGWDSAVYGTALGTLNWQYAPPYVVIDVSWVGASSYTPPVSPLAAIWVVGPPADDTTVYGAGFESSVFGEPLTWWPQSISPEGLYATEFGRTAAFREGEYPPSHGTLHADWLGSPLYTPYEGWAFALWKVLPEGAVWAYGFDHSRFSSASHVWNKRQYIEPPGAFTESFGGTELILKAQGVSVGGIAPPPQTGPNEFRGVPSPFIDFRTRYLDIDDKNGGVPAGAVGTPIVTSEVQFIDLAGRGPNPWVTGNARIEYAVRYIEPPFIASNVFGSHNVARIQVVALSGWESSFLSENHEFDINLQRVFHHSGVSDPAGYGVSVVRNEHEILYPQTILPGAPGFPIVYNLTQQLFVQPYMDTNSDPTQWPNWAPWVENRTRYLGPGGWQSSRFSVIGNIIENTAAPLLPDGLDATLWGPETFIAHRIRYVGPEGWDSFYNTRYTVVYNGAFVLAPTGWASSRLGVPTQVLNLNRTVLQHSGWEGPLWGLPFIADRTRTVYPNLFYDVPSGFPEVRLNPYPIAPAGIDSYRTGGHAVAEHFNVVFAKSANVHPNPLVGEPIVENRNKALAVFPSDQSLYGLAEVFNYNTHLTITAGDLSAWGAHLIGYRTRTITVAPVSVPVFSVTHQVRNVLPDPPARQLIEPGGIYIGPEARPGIIPPPTFNYVQVRPGGIFGGGYGSPVLTENSIRPGSIVDLAQVGTPILLLTQYLYPEGVPWPRAGHGGPDGSVGDSDLLAHAAKPSVSPHTIYAPAADQATAQARANHPQNSPHAIDTYAFPGGDRFGRHWVSNYHREIGPVPRHGSWAPTSRFGTPDLMLRIRYVYPQPIRSLRTGLPVFLGVPQFITFEWYGGWLSEIFGGHAVGHAPVRHMPTPAGFVATAWGTHRVELLNREISPQGIPHRGNPQQGLTNPWGNPLVGYPRTYVFGGFIATLWGTHRVEHRIRHVFPTGWDSYADTLDDLSGWGDRMRVIRTNPPGGVPGIPSTAEFGTHMVSSSIRTILGRGISGYNSGDHIVKTASVVLPAGWDSLEVGDIDRWEAGKIKPHGDDLSIMGTPRMLSPLRPSGPADGAVGAPRIGVPLYPLGIPEIGFAGPSVSNPFGCTNRVVTPLPILSQQNVPQPVVT